VQYQREIEASRQHQVYNPMGVGFAATGTEGATQ